MAKTENWLRAPPAIITKKLSRAPLSIIDRTALGSIRALHKCPDSKEQSIIAVYIIRFLKSGISRHFSGLPAFYITSVFPPRLS